MNEVKEEIKLMKGEITGEALILFETQNPNYKRVMFETGGFAEDGEIAVIYVKPFNRILLSEALKIRDKGELDLGNWMLVNMRIGGVEIIDVLNDMDMLNNFSFTAAYLIRPKIGAIKKK